MVNAVKLKKSVSGFLYLRFYNTNEKIYVSIKRGKCSHEYWYEQFCCSDAWFNEVRSQSFAIQFSLVRHV